MSCAVLIAVVFGARLLGAQGGGVAGPDPYRWAVAIAADGAIVPDAYSLRCGDGDGVPAIGGGIAAFFRPRGWLVIEGDTRASAVPGIRCHIFIPPSAQPPGYFDADTQYSNETPHMPLIRSALRVGVETSPEWPLLRATVGGGMIWTNGLKPFGTAAIGVGSRGDGARVFAELESNVSRVRVVEGHTFVVSDSAGRFVYSTRFDRRDVLPVWVTLHLGLEIPLVHKP